MATNSSSIAANYNQDVNMSDESKKHNHSEIEKRRRDKMNHYITELSCLIPMCNAISRKLDKLTVLRMAVQHMKTIKGNMNAFAASNQIKPTFLSDEALLDLILQISDGFLFVVSCDRGKILFVSKSVSQVLNYSQSELLGQNWFDILHPKDVAKVKEQLSFSDLSPKERFIDAKTMLTVKTNPTPSNQTSMCPGARRSFFCRMKFKSLPKVKEENDQVCGYGQKRRKSHNSDRKYCVIHCIGYLKSWISSKINIADEMELDNSDVYGMSCLVAIGCILPNYSYSSPYKQDILLKAMNFTSRHTIDGKFLFVDQTATLILGYLPQELLGTCCYEYCHPEDLKILAESHRQGLQSNGDMKVESSKYRFKAKNGSYIYLKTCWKTFKNPWTKEFEFLVAINSCVNLLDRDIEDNCNNTIKNCLKSSSSANCGDNKWPQNDVKPSNGGDFSINEILMKIKNSRSSKKSSGNNSNNNHTNNSCNNNSNNHNNSNNNNGDASSTEQTSTGYSSTDAKSVQKMLTTSRVALWKIGRYIADEVLENQRQNEESNCISYSSSSPINNVNGNNDRDNFNVDLIDLQNKWKCNGKQLDPLIGSDSIFSVNEIWPSSNVPADSSSSTLVANHDNLINSSDCITNSEAIASPVNTNNNNDLCMIMDTSLENGSKNSAIYQQSASNYDSFMINDTTSCNREEKSNCPETVDDTFYRQVENWPKTGENTQSMVTMEGENHQIMFNELNNPVDQENEDAAMDLIMSILEADGSLGDPVNLEKAPCPWI